ncbi:MAG TPA: tRNA preQ1(34) S-adenosylmethionine ribosyltransferase-isomerase QueA [Bryobacteraceae bacterium]|jgi:S-adenosylmethionine:tRNA ribosyltransferase-isomerase|nr:tRNA preQ1(34) S-adenosylmethionine ribosyltransferase-isomerase QueA [Bryobacteraceae bacterium]
MDLAAFDYHLPEELIAQEALPDRAASRMLVLHRGEQRWEDRTFRELPSFLRPGDCLVLNDSRVFPARLFGHRSGVHALPVGKRNPKRTEHLSGAVEVFLLQPVSSDGKDWEALVRPGRKMRTGERIHFEDGMEGEIVARGEFGERTIRFHTDADLFQEFERIGHVPLPPYIKRGDRPQDRERYQTVFARERGSVAAPTAGLHFTPEVLDECRARAAEIAYVTLHVGLGTFQPLHAEQVEQAHLHAERYSISDDNAAKLRAARRLVAVGTTSVRTIETMLRQGETQGATDLFIYPGFEFRGTGAMLTNFHLPRTSLLLLVCAFAGTELALAAYRHAVEERYRFYSYGDCMLIV